MAYTTLSLRTRVMVAGIAAALVIVFTAFSLADSSADNRALPTMAVMAVHAS